MEIGNTVKLKAPVIQGPIIDTEFDKDAKELKHLVEYADADGETQQRWFLQSSLEAV